MVWHFRRNTVKAYLKQQMGYGKAEALLYFKHPYRFNLLGQSRWLGRIYGELDARRCFSRRPVIYYGAFGRGLFQTLYEPPSSLLRYLPFTLEWNAIGILLFLAGLVSPRVLPIAALPLADLHRLGDRHGGDRAASTRASTGSAARALVALLTYLGPLVRSLQRYLWRLRGRRRSSSRCRSTEPRQRAARSTGAARTFVLRYWSEAGHEKESFLRRA